MIKIGYAGILAHEDDLEEQIELFAKSNLTDVVIEPKNQIRRGRSALFTALETMREGDALVVTNFDRLAMSLAQLLETMRHLNEIGVDLISIENGVDTRKQKTFFHLIEELSLFDEEIGHSNLMAGIAAAKQRGRSGGRPTVLDNHGIESCRKMLMEDEFSIAQIAKKMKVSVATIYRYFPGGRSRLK